ncbi:MULTISPECIES: NTP transferase domain-containing protein [Clostridia]|jgi:CTP:phosphocholine cytidylyltransferase-like protein/thiamine kinase-like enzyme|uniref:NTP transferase domain-containing protein n=1 Tax=Clostridia TaxID=186801 RepID=UPI001FA934FD|nr:MULTISPECIES: NTP transferase domain-containing protein [Clostridia]
MEENYYVDVNMQRNGKTKAQIHAASPKNAIILAAGYGMRMVPINTEVSKGLLEIHGEPLIERLIRQLHEAEIYDIYIVVGFMKERYEYLIDEYRVELIVNPEYTTKNNLYSLKCAEKYISNTYIVPCDIWCEHNLFRKQELYSWYMVNNSLKPDSCVLVNQNMELNLISETDAGNGMIGISYLTGKEAQLVKQRIKEMCSTSCYTSAFWEETLYEKRKMIVPARVVDEADVVEINTFEQLRELDSGCDQLKTDAIQIIEEVFQVSQKDIKNITVLKKGMTNRSFLFECKEKKYIMRIPGEGTDKLINRREEAEVYQKIADYHICDRVIYMNPENGYKITEYMNSVRNCDAEQMEDVKKCMKKLREFHELKLKVNHEFDLFEHIQFYEQLWEGSPSTFKDYAETKRKVFSLKSYVEQYCGQKVLTHIDAVPDNFLFWEKNPEETDIRLIDWEYAAMQDPHVDIAMFCIYAMYNRTHIDQTIDAYFTEGCAENIRIKIYAYIAICGLLWSNWCEYKRNLGVEFGEYSLRQYRYAKEYYAIVETERRKVEI